MTEVAYWDTSALAKLVVTEGETTALRTWMSGPGGELTTATSALTAVELVRAARRTGLDAEACRGALAGSAQIAVSRPILSAAAGIDPPGLRSLDAVHLASALQIGSSLAVFVAYDGRLLAAARALGLPVVSPA